MSEIIQISIGGCGIQIGKSFWERILQEHQLDPSGAKTKQETKEEELIDRTSVYFNESKNGNFFPRAFLLDCSPSGGNPILSSKIGKLFPPQNTVFGKNGCGNIWSRGHYTEGAELIHEIVEAVRGEVEMCDSFQGFQYTHSITGGTGSGLGTLVMCKLREEYPDRITQSFSVFSSPKESELVTDPYNMNFSVHQLVENNDLVHCIDNQSIFKICERNSKESALSFQDINHVISRVISDVTCGLRFPGELNADLRKLCASLVPFPRLHFFFNSCAPAFSKGPAIGKAMSPAELTREAFLEKNTLCSIDPRHGKTLASFVHFRGSRLSIKEVEESIEKQHRSRNSSYYVDWISAVSKVALCDKPSIDSKTSATLTLNNSSIKELLKLAVSEKVTAMYKRKAFYHWYSGEGMDSMEFEEALSNLNDLISEYQQYQDATGTVEEEEFEEIF